MRRFIFVLAVMSLAACNSNSPSNQPPTTGNITVTPLSAGLINATSFSFTINGVTDPNNDTIMYAWDFADGSAAGAGSTVQHAYTQTGTFNVKVTASDGHNTPVNAANLNVNVRTLTATWQGQLTCNGAGCVGSPRTITLNLTQTGATVSGTCSDSHVGTQGPITVQTFAIDAGSGQFNFSGSCGSGNVLFGMKYDPGADQWNVSNWDSPPFTGALTRH